MRNRIIQRGGTIIVVVNPKTGEEIIIDDPVSDSRIVFDNLKNVICISVDSNGSFIFVCEILSLSDGGRIFLQSQTLGQKGRPPLTQDQALSRPRNIGAGMPLTRICMKVVFVGERPGRVNGLYTKEVVTLETAQQEVQTQHRMYRQLISGGTGVHTAIIPDAFGSCLLTCDEFQSLLPKSKQDPDSLIQTLNVLNWILSTARSNGFQLYVSFIEYLEGFESFNETNTLHKWNIPSIGEGAVAILLKTGCLSVDMYYKNIMINNHGNAVRFIDFGRRVCFTSPEDLANVKKLFKKYSKYCQPDELKLLDMCFPPSVPSEKTKEEALRESVQLKFNEYCDAVPSRLEHWKTLTQPQEKVKEVFDLLTFIGFIDCLYGFSKRRDAGQYIFLMQFGLFMNLLLGREMDRPFLIDDIVEIRSHLHDLDNWLTHHNDCNKMLIGLVETLSDLLKPDEALGRPRESDSFHFGDDSQQPEGISPSPSPSPSHPRSPSPDRKKHKAGGRKPITKKRRRVKRKTRVSRRKY
jgi:hypothetical protein